MLSPWHLLGGVIALNLAFLLAIMGYRQWHAYRAIRQKRFIALWRPVLMQCSLGELPSRLPQLRASQRLLFLSLWIDTQQQLNSDASPRLSHLFDYLQLRDYTLRLLHTHHLSKQLLATRAFGYLKEAEHVWPELVKNALGSQARLSFFSIHALVQMSPEAALPVLVSALQAGRVSKTRLLGLFRRFPSPSLVGPLADRLQDALYANDLTLALHLIDLLELLPYPSVLPVIRQILVEAQSADLILSCLGIMTELHDPWALGLALPYLQHPDWRVRRQAVRALSVVAQSPQIPHLLAALDDSSYWVASAALEALYHLPGIKRGRLHELADTHAKPEVQKMIQQYLAAHALSKPVPRASSLSKQEKPFT